MSLFSAVGTVGGFLNDDLYGTNRVDANGDRLRRFTKGLSQVYDVNSSYYNAAECDFFPGEDRLLINVLDSDGSTSDDIALHRASDGQLLNSERRSPRQAIAAHPNGNIFGIGGGRLIEWDSDMNRVTDTGSDVTQSNDYSPSGHMNYYNDHFYTAITNDSGIRKVDTNGNIVASANDSLSKGADVVIHTNGYVYGLVSGDTIVKYDTSLNKQTSTSIGTISDENGDGQNITFSRETGDIYAEVADSGTNLYRLDENLNVLATDTFNTSSGTGGEIGMCFTRDERLFVSDGYNYVEERDSNDLTVVQSNNSLAHYQIQEAAPRFLIYGHS